MSGRRDPLFFEIGSLQTVSGGELFVTSVSPNATNLKDGDIPPDSHKNMKGIIESVTIKLKGIAELPLDFIVFSGSNGASTVLANDRYLEHESFVTGDYLDGPTGESPAVRRVGASGLSLPTVDRDRSKKIHIGIRNNGATAIPVNAMTVGWVWRADYGEP